MKPRSQRKQKNECNVRIDQIVQAHPSEITVYLVEYGSEATIHNLEFFFLMFRLRRESESFLEMAPWKFESRIELDISAEVCFEILMDDRSFIHWHPEITNIKWLIPSSPRTPTTPSPPKTSGSRRTMVYKDWLCYALLAGPVTIEEEYVLVDNENFEIQISFASIGRPTFLMFHAFREQYKVESMGASRCKLIRRIGVEPAFLSRRIFGCITYPTMKKTFEESCPQRLKKALAEKKLPIVT